MTMPTYKQVIRRYENELTETDKDSNVPKVLFYHLAQKEPHQLYLMMDEEVEPELLESFEKAMALYMQGYPVQYIKGVETFFGRDFIVNENVLIPRYETEELVENILYHIDDYFEPSIPLDVVDVGTGSGAIAISLKAEEARLNVTATDISFEALDVAKQNAQNIGVEIDFMQGDILQPLLDQDMKFDIFISNPPYIPQEQDIEAVVKNNEPHVALFGGKDGLYFYRKIFEGVQSLLKERAILAFEMGFDQKEDMEKEMNHYFPNTPFKIIKDMNGKDRLLFIYHNIEPKKL